VLNALYFLPLLVMSRNRKHTDVPAQNRIFATPVEMLQIVTTFILTLVAWVFFRAESMAHALQYLSGMFSSTVLSPPTVAPYGLLVIVAVFTGIEWLQRHKQHALQVDTRHPVYYNVNRFLVAATCWAIFIWAQTGYKEFIYFQF
jgi:D-alanyl-lipoteichoic acid acyltransferase DltB (MBOAT superfamily)